MSGRRSIVAAVACFLVFGVLLALAVLVPGWSEDRTMDRIIFTIWLSTLCLVPALGLFAAGGGPRDRRGPALWLYTCAYVAYMVHFYYAVFEHFGGVEATFRGMRQPIAAINFILTAWWTIDLIVAWAVPSGAGWAYWLHTATWAFLYVVTVVTDLRLRPNPVTVPLGVALAAVVPLGLLVRWWRGGERSEARIAGQGVPSGP